MWWLCPPSWISVSLCPLAFVSEAFLRFCFLWSSFVSLLSLFLFVSFLSPFVSFYVVALCAFLGLCLLLSPVALCLPLPPLSPFVSLSPCMWWCFRLPSCFFFVFVSFVCLHSRVVHLRAVRVSLLLSPGHLLAQVTLTNGACLHLNCTSFSGAIIVILGPPTSQPQAVPQFFHLLP